MAHLFVVQDDVSGDYKEILLAMIGERPPPAPVAEEEDAGEPELEEVEEEHIEVWLYFICCVLSCHKFATHCRIIKRLTLSSTQHKQ